MLGGSFWCARRVALQRIGDNPVELAGLDGKFYVVLVANPLQAQLGQLVQWNSAMDDDGDVCCSGMIPQSLE